MWSIHKRYKSVDWSGIDWSVEGHVGCPYCTQELGGDNSQDNFMVYGLDENGLPRGGFCFSCNTTVVSVEKALEDEQNKSSTSGKVASSNLLSKKSNIKEFKEESKVSFSANKLSKDQQKLNDKRLSQEHIDKIHSETSDTFEGWFSWFR